MKFSPAYTGPYLEGVFAHGKLQDLAGIDLVVLVDPKGGQTAQCTPATFTVEGTDHNALLFSWWTNTPTGFDRRGLLVATNDLPAIEWAARMAQTKPATI